MENWRLQGSDPNDAKGLVQVLYRAAAKTFQSPRVMRHLMYALEASGNYVDAERSLFAYMLIVENEKKTLARIGNGSSLSTEQQVIQDIDSDQDTIRTMAAGVRLLVKFQNNGKKAMEVAATMEQSAKSWNINDPEILGAVWHAIGIANSLWSMQSAVPPLMRLITAIEAASRQTFQSTAITAYMTALSHTPNALETYYQLALQHSIQRNLEKSITALSHALRLKKSHVPSIHLLALVLTAVQDYEKALQTCHTVKFDQVNDLQLDDAVALMEMQLTYLRIVEMVSGKDLALEVQKGVFTLYNRIFGPVKPATGYIKKETDFEQRAEPQLRRSKSNVPERPLNAQISLGRESMESNSKLSLQVTGKKISRARSLLRRRPRSRSVDGRSLDTRSSGSVSELPPSGTPCPTSFINCSIFRDKSHSHPQCSGINPTSAESWTGGHSASRCGSATSPESRVRCTLEIHLIAL
jgi:tetratricopeptide (TPR) repeat protein